jgi:amino acid permease
MRTKNLTFWEASSLIMGAGVGAGILAVPYFASLSGFSVFVVVLALAYLASCLLHLMLAEVMFRTDRELQIVELMRRYVFRGKAGAWMVWPVFGLLVVAFIANLSAYVSGAGEIVAKLTGLPPRVAELIVYAFSAGVVFFGLKVVGVFEKLGALAMFALVLALAAGAFTVPFRLRIAPRGTWREALALYGMVMYGYYAFFTVPQAVKGLAPDRGKAVRSIVTGLAMNGALMAVIAVVSLGISREVTKLAIIGVTDALGRWADIAGSLFTLLALMTSYWSVSLALADVIRERTGIHPKVSWVLATLPSLLLLYAGIWRFMDLLRLAGGATAIVVVLITLPMFVNARRSGDVPDPAWSLGRWGGPAVLAFVLIASLLMVAGSFVSL